MANRQIQTFILILAICQIVTATTDISLMQIVNIANQLPISDCRRLVASLDSESFEFPNAASSAATKLPKEANCVDLLGEWYSEKGDTQTHVVLARRLKQIGYEDLSKSVLSRSEPVDEDIDSGTESFSFEVETESWTEYEVEAKTPEKVTLDTTTADLFAEFLAAIAGLTGLLYVIAKLVKRCKKEAPNSEGLPLKSSQY